MRRFFFLVLLAVVAFSFKENLMAGGEPEVVILCHDSGTPTEQTLFLSPIAAKVHQRHGDQLGACGPACALPAPIEEVDPGTEPLDGEPKFVSETVVTLEGATETGFNPVGLPITLRLGCPYLRMRPDAVIVYDNGEPLPFESLGLTHDSVTLSSGITSGRHELSLVATDIYGYTLQATFVVWAGETSLPVAVIDEDGAPVAGAEVVARLSDDPDVSAILVTDASGEGAFSNLPSRSYNLIAQTTDNRIAIQPTSVPASLVVMRLKGFEPPSPIDNNDFSLGTDGWVVGTAPVSIVPHVEGSPTGSTVSALHPGATAARPQRTAGASAAAAPSLQWTTSAAAGSDFDLVLATSGEGQQSISRTFEVEAGVESIALRFRFITSEVPGGWFGSQYNDFYNVAIRSSSGGGSVINGNSMNGLGLGAFDSGGATAWYETELPVSAQGDTIQLDIAVANVADGLFDSQVAVDVVKKKRLTISAVQLNDIDNAGLQFLSASSHAYFDGQTRVHGTITIQGPAEDTLEELTLEVLEGGQRIATGTLASSLAQTLLTQFGEDEQIRLSTSQLLFEIPGGQLAAANQSANGQLTLRVKARSTSGENAEKEFGAVTKLVRFAGGNRYGGRDENRGGDDWAKPGVRALIADAGQTWGDFSNMNGGSFAPDHSSHRTGNSADGWFAGYNARDAATAATIIGHLNTHGGRIRSVYVTFSANSSFANAIANVTLDDGRAATSVIRNVAGHTTHFHWEVSDN